MLITERTSDGRTIVRLHRDWHPGRIGAGYTPPPRNYMLTDEDYHAQYALLRAGATVIRASRKVTNLLTVRT